MDCTMLVVVVVVVCGPVSIVVELGANLPLATPAVTFKSNQMGWWQTEARPLDSVALK